MREDDSYLFDLDNKVGRRPLCPLPPVSRWKPGEEGLGGQWVGAWPGVKGGGRCEECCPPFRMERYTASMPVTMATSAGSSTTCVTPTSFPCGSSCCTKTCDFHALPSSVPETSGRGRSWGEVARAPPRVWEMQQAWGQQLKAGGRPICRRGLEQLLSHRCTKVTLEGFLNSPEHLRKILIQ